MSCTMCGLCKTAKTVLVPIRGQLRKPKILFVGSAPGPQDDESGQNFTGGTGDLLASILAEIGIPADAVAYDNVVHCWPRDQFGQTRDPDEDEMITCAPFLWNMVKATDPDVIVTLGTLAYRAVTGDKVAFITEAHGRASEVRIAGKDRIVVGTFHPSAVLRQRDARGQILKGVPQSYYDNLVADLRYAWDHANGLYFLPPVEIINNTDQAVKLIEHIVELYLSGQIQFVALDTEGPQIQLTAKQRRELGIDIMSTDIWDPNKKTVGVSLAYVPPGCTSLRDIKGYYIPMEHPESLVDYQLVGWALKWALDKNGKVRIPVSFHNQKYDDQWCREKHDFQAICYHDTMLGSFVYHGQSISHGLGNVAHKLLKYALYKDEPGEFLDSLPLEMRSFYYVPLAILGKYAAIDAAATASLTVVEMAMLERSGQTKITQVLTEGTSNFADIEYHGAAIDFEKWQHHMSNYPKMMDDAAADLLTLPMVQVYINDRKTIWTQDQKGNPRPPNPKFEFNPNSPPQRYDLLYRYYNFPEEYAEETKSSQEHEDDPDYIQVFSTNENSRHMMTLHVRDEKYEGKCSCRSYVPGWDTFVYLPAADVLARYMQSKKPSQGTIETLYRISKSENPNICARSWDYYHPVNFVHYNIDPHPEGYEFLIKIRFWGKLRKVYNDYLKKIQHYFRPVEWQKAHGDVPDNIRILNNNYILHWVKTGRLCTRDFAIHTVPWHSDPRRLFVSRWKNTGGLMLSADYSQLELRVAAAMGKDEKLIQAYRDGKDVHRVTASNVYKVPENEVTQAMRRYSKTMSFRLIYGGGANAIADETGLTKKEAQVMIDAFLATYTGIKKSIDGFHHEVETTGRVITPMRRVFYLPDIFSDDDSKHAGALRDSQNYPIQSSSSDITMTAINFVMRTLRQTGMNSLIWAMIHDAIENDIYPGELLPFYKILKKAMEEDVCREYEWLCVPMVAEFELGTRWDGALTVKELTEERMILKGRRGFYEETLDHLARGYRFESKITKEVYTGTHRPCKGEGEVNALNNTCKKCGQVVNPETDLDYGETLILRKSYEGDSGGNTEVTTEIVWRQFMEQAA